MQYRLPRPIFDLLQESFGDKQKAEIFAQAIESSIQAIDTKAVESIIEKKQALKAELYDGLRNELATKEFVRAEINELRYEMRQQQLLLKVLIGLMIFGLTLANPAVIGLVSSLK